MKAIVVYGSTADSIPQCMFGGTVKDCLSKIQSSYYIFGYRMFVKAPMVESNRISVVRSAADKIWRNITDENEPFVIVNQTKCEFSDSMIMHLDYMQCMKRLFAPSINTIISENYAVGFMDIRIQDFFSMDEYYPRISPPKMDDSPFELSADLLHPPMLFLKFRKSQVKFGSRVMNIGTMRPAGIQTAEIIRLIYRTLINEPGTDKIQVMVHIDKDNTAGWSLPKTCYEYYIPKPDATINPRSKEMEEGVVDDIQSLPEEIDDLVVIEESSEEIVSGAEPVSAEEKMEEAVVDDIQPLLEEIIIGENIISGAEPVSAEEIAIDEDIVSAEEETLYSKLIKAYGESLIVPPENTPRRLLRPKIYLEKYTSAIDTDGSQSVFESIAGSNNELVSELDACGKKEFCSRYNVSAAMFRKCMNSNKLFVGIIK